MPEAKDWQDCGSAWNADDSSGRVLLLDDDMGSGAQVGILRRGRYIKGKKVGKGPMVDLVSPIKPLIYTSVHSIDSALQQYCRQAH